MRVSIEQLIASLKSGEVASFPTDTVPALAARPDCAEKIYELKQRDRRKALILMGAEPSDLWPFVAGSTAEQALWAEAADRYWPGALTLVLPAAADRVSPQTNGADPTTIGLRVPKCTVARLILAQTGPLATTSVNRSGQPPLRTIADIERVFPNLLTLSPDDIASYGDSEVGSGLPSTVVTRVATRSAQTWQILRQGSVSFTDP